MICSRCGKETAQIYVKKLRDEDARVSLCPECHRELFPNAAQSTLPYSEVPAAASDACPVCGTTMQDFRRTGLLGCAYCYTAFAEELLPVVRSIQADVKHSGPKPKDVAAENYDKVTSLIDKRDSLKAKIEEALRSGSFSRAKELGDALQEINRELRKLSSENADRRIK